MERNGLVSRKVHAVITPRVEYGQTELGRSLGAAVCGLWTWVEDNAGRLSAARKAFDSARPAE
jgi:DNA-binding HxlR family transcriptional regulator